MNERERGRKKGVGDSERWECNRAGKRVGRRKKERVVR